MKQFFDKHIDKFGEKEALGYIHDKIEEAKFAMLNGVSDEEYLLKLEEAHEMLGDYLSRKVSPATSLPPVGAGRGNRNGVNPPRAGGIYSPYYPIYPYGKKGPYFK